MYYLLVSRYGDYTPVAVQKLNVNCVKTCLLYTAFRDNKHFCGKVWHFCLLVINISYQP
jgi:hypothetical protein